MYLSNSSLYPIFSYSNDNGGVSSNSNALSLIGSISNSSYGNSTLSIARGAVGSIFGTSLINENDYKLAFEIFSNLSSSTVGAGRAPYNLGNSKYLILVSTYAGSGTYVKPFEIPPAINPYNYCYSF